MGDRYFSKRNNQCSDCKCMIEIKEEKFSIGKRHFTSAVYCSKLGKTNLKNGPCEGFRLNIKEDKQKEEKSKHDLLSWTGC